MRSLLFSLLLLLHALSIESVLAQQNVIEPHKQIRNDEPFVYECLTDIPIYGYDFIKGKVDTQTVEIAPTGYIFDIINAYPLDTSILKCRVCVIKECVTSAKKQQQTTYQARTATSSTANTRYYAIKLNDVFTKVRKRYLLSTYPTVGVAFVPIKVRLKLTDKSRFDFSQDIMLGTSIGLRSRTDPYFQYYHTYLLSLGVTSVVADSSSTQGYIKDGNTKLAAFTPSIGSLWEFNDIQLGLFLGADWVGGELGSKWVYQGLPWVSVGIGYQLFGKSK
jgi:hypothetical protein